MELKKPHPEEARSAVSKDACGSSNLKLARSATGPDCFGGAGLLERPCVTLRDPARGRRFFQPADENLDLQQQSPARRGDFRLSRTAARQGERAAVFRYGGVCRDPG